MKSFATEQELELKTRLLPFPNVPISFSYGGRQISGIPTDFTVSTEGTDIYATNEDGLEIHAQYTPYEDFPAAEWLVTFTNRGKKPTPIISDIRIEGIIPLPLHTLYHGNGDTKDHSGYRWFTTPITEKPSLCPTDGTSCKGAFPYMRLLGENIGVSIAIGWTGKWNARFEPAEGGVKISVGQARCHMTIYPGETIRVPRLTMVAYEGNHFRAINMWRRWYLKYILPNHKGQPVKPMCYMHYFTEGHAPEFTGATEAGQLHAIDCYLQGGIKPDALWIDAGWYPCDQVWQKTGTWHPDPVRFPNGLAPIGKKCHAHDIEFLLWFEPERVRPDTQWAKEYPQWLLQAVDEEGHELPNRLLNLGDPDCCNMVIETVDRCIKEYGVDIYRQDFNFDPYPCWVQNEAADRVGALENLHIQGYYRFLDSLLERNPGLLIDSCASGGRRNDLETMRRSITLHYTDIGYGHHPTKQLQHRQMFEWIPYFRAHAWSWDDPETGAYGQRIADSYPREADEFAFYCALTPALTDRLIYNDSAQLFRLSEKMQPIWRRAAELMLKCDYYPLTQCRVSQEDFYAMVFYSPENGNGFLNVISNNRNPETAFTAMLDMLEEGCSYRFTEAETGNTQIFSGKAFRVTLPPRSGVVYFIEKI